MTEEVPRHGGNPPSEISQHSLPEPLKGRLNVTVINEPPPGQNTTGIPQWDQKSYTRLTVACGNLLEPILVDINYLDYLSTTTFQRDNDTWYMCHSWTKTWGEGAQSFTSFVNLRTGEYHKVPPLNFWKGTISISPNGKLVMITGGIIATSMAQLLIIDISDFSHVETIHREAFDRSPDYGSLHFDDESNFVIEYVYKFGRYRKSSSSDTSSENTNNSVICFVPLNDDGKYEDYIFDSLPLDNRPPTARYLFYDNYGYVVETRKTVTRKYNPDKKGTGGEIKIKDEMGRDVKNTAESYYSFILVNNMDVISETVSDNYEKYSPYMKSGLSEALIPYDPNEEGSSEFAADLEEARRTLVLESEQSTKS